MTEPKKVETWMPFLIDKYLGDTTHLSTEQHGAYMLLLFSMWKHGGRLPADEVQLKNITKLSPKKWSTSRAVLLAFFRVEGDGLTQKRLTAELSRAIANVQQKSAAGKASAEAKKSQRKGNARSTDVATDVATATPTKRQRRAKPIPIPPSLPSREGCETPSGASPAQSQETPVVEPEAGRTVPAWEAYAKAYEVRYGTLPVRNKRGNSLLAKFIELVPMDEAPAIAAHFVGNNGGLYVAASHALQLLVRDAEKLRMEWKTGRGQVATLVESPIARERRVAAGGFGTGRAAAPVPVAARPQTPILEAEAADGVARISR